MIVKVFLTLNIDEDEYPVPVDGEVDEEISQNDIFPYTLPDESLLRKNFDLKGGGLNRGLFGSC